MDLDEEFDKMYGDTGSAQEDADLDAEFEKMYGQVPSSVPAASEDSAPLPSKDGDEGEVVQMSHEKPGPRAVSTTGGNEEKVKPLRWEDGDGGEECLPDGERNQWGGNLRNEGRKVLFRRNKDGKVIGYSTTSSMLVRHDDGKFAVVPTVVGGKELSQEEAVKHYAETGEHWGMADDEESAQKMAQEVHDTHMKGNQAKWNDWIHENWDKVSDEIRSDRGTAYEHEKRTAPDKTQKASAGVEYGKIALETAKGAGEGWIQGIDEGTQNVIHGGIDFVGSVLNSIGRGLGGTPTFRQVSGTDARTGKPTMWAVRRAPHKGETEDGKDERDAPRRWLDGIGDAIIDYAEGLKKRNDERFHASDEFFSNLAGDIMPIVATGGLATPTLVANGYADNYDNLYKQARESGKSHEEADRIASTGGVINAAIMGVVAKGPLKTWVGKRFGQNVARALGKSVMDGEANSMSGIVRSGTKWLFKNTVKDVGVSTVESGLLFGGQAAFNEGASEYARGEDVDPMKITMAGYEGAKSGVAMSLAMGGVQLIGQRAQYRRDVEDAAWKRTKSPRGATFNAMWFNEGTADLLKAEKDGTLKNGKRFRDLKDRSGLPSDMTAKEAEAYAKTLRSLGFTEENLRFFRRDKENYKRLGLREGDVSGVPMPDNPDVTLPPEAGASELMARELRSRGIEPVKFTVPSQPGADGRPVPRFTKVNVKDNYGGVNGVFNIAIDENAKVAIIDNGDGTYTAYDSYRNSETADSIDEAIEKAQMLALIQQVQNSDRQVKEQVIRTEAEKYGKWDTLYYPTMEDAANAVDKLIAENGGKWNGLTDTSFLRTPDKAGRDAFYVSDNRNGGKKHGVAFLILDNINGVEDIPRILGHEHVGHGGPNAEFGGSGGAVEFAENIRSKEFEAFKKDVVAGARSEVRARDMEAVNRNLGEVFAHYAAANLDSEPSNLDKLVSAVNGAARKLKLRKTYSSADVKTMMARWKTAGRGEGGIVEGRADVPERFEFFPVEERKTTTEVKDETGDVRDEAPAQPEQGAPEPAGGEAARPVEAQPQGGEAPRHGAVEPAKTGSDAAEAPTEAPPPMRTEHDFLRVMHDNQKPVRVPVGEIALPDTQFKEGADPKTGVVKGQELKGEYFESAENAVVVYVRKDGTKELVTGRHRFDLAKRNGKNDILARVFRESDGYTPEDMRNLDAISNIIDEKGTEHDYIRYFDSAKPTRAEAESAGFLSRPKGRNAYELYEGATEGTRAAIDWSGSGADGLISPEQAGIIAKAAPRNAHPRNGAVQRILVKKAQDGLRGDRLAIVARSLAEEAKRRKTPAADGETQLDLFTSEEDLALLALEEKRAAKRVEKANEYGRVASVLQTAMQKGGRLDLNKAYARELGIKNPKDRKQLADARQKALEKADYWRNAVRLDEADKEALDAELGIAPKENLELESVTGDQIAEENRKRAEKEEIERRKAAPLKGGAGEVGQSLMDLGGAEGEDLFNRTQRPEPVAEKSAEPARPVKGAQATAPKAEAAEKPAPAMPTPETTTLLETEKERYIAFQGAHNAFDKVFREAKGDLSASSVQPFVEELKAVIAASPTKELQRRDKSLKRIDTGREEDSYHHVRQMIAEELKRRENGPVSAPKEAEATTPPRAAKPAEGRKSGDTAVVKESLTTETTTKPVGSGKTPEDSTIVSGDEVRKTMPGYNRLDWSTHVDRTGYVGPRLEAQFQRLLKERKGKGNGTVVFLAGGNGAGKSTSVSAAELRNADFVIDSTLGNLDVAKRQIDAILANGQTPVIHFVYRTPGQALEGIAQRVKNGGHIVSPLSFANSHVKSRENLRLLSDAYGDKIQLRIYDNSVEGAPEITLKQLEAKGKPDHARIRESANYFLGHLRDRETAISGNKGGVAGGGAKGARGQVDGAVPASEADRQAEPSPKPLKTPVGREEAAGRGKMRPSAETRSRAVSGASDGATWRDASGKERKWPGFVPPSSLAPKEGLYVAVQSGDGAVFIGKVAKVTEGGVELQPQDDEAARTFPLDAVVGVRDPAVPARRRSVARPAGEVDFYTPGLYTGSAADYERPSLHYVGTGEGNQVYGWGLYASDRRGVAEGYANSDAKRRASTPDEMWPKYKGKFDSELEHDPVRTFALKYVAREGSVDAAIQFLRTDDWTERAAPKAREAAEWLEKNRDDVTPPQTPSEHLYEQTWFTDRAPGDESHLLKWYGKVTASQKKWIKAQAEREGLDVSNIIWDGGKIDGAMLYNYLATPSYLGSPKAASEFLARAGIDGVKYPVDSYGKALKDGDEAGWNYVSFRDDNIRVDHKWADGEIQFDTPELSPEGRREHDEVVARYTNADGTKKPGWMKAPNGKPTKLTERQWAQVRTPSFKKWFGDWERLAELYAARDFALNSEPVAEVSGNDFQKDPAGANTLIDRVADYFAGLGGKAESPDLGTVELTRRGVKSSVAHGIGAKKAAAFAAVKDVIEKGVVFDRNGDWKGRGYATAAIAAPIRMGGKDYVCELIVNRYKDRNAFYLHEVNLKEKLSDTIKTATGAVSIGESARPVMSIIAQRLAEVNPASVSKVVDENGEPLVVWHGTNKKFSIFDKDRQGYDPGFFFAENATRPKEGWTKEYAEYYGGNLMPAFLRNATKMGRGEWRVENANDIKSATDNNGDFSRTNPDINFDTPELNAKQERKSKIKLSVGGISLDNLRKLFDKLNDEAVGARLADAIFAAAKRAGIVAAVDVLPPSDQLRGNGKRPYGMSFRGYVKYDMGYMNSGRFSDGDKASTILHELIHGLTSYAISAVHGDIQGEVPKRLKVNEELVAAVKDLEAIFEEVRSKFSVARETAYAMSDIHEFLAEYSNPAVRRELEKHSIWRRIIDGIKRVLRATLDFFVDPGSKAGEVAGDEQVNGAMATGEVLDRFLENFDKRAFDRTMAFDKNRPRGDKFWDFPLEQYEAHAKMNSEVLFDSPELDPMRRAEEVNTYARRYYERHKALHALERPTRESVMDAAEGRWQKLRRALQDKNLVIREVEERLGVTDKKQSVYYAKDREFGLNEHQLGELQRRRVEPIFDALADVGVGQEAFDLYLIARHAPYRNALVRGRNGTENGSGMSDADADAVIGRFRALGVEGELARIADMVYDMNDEALQRLVDSGRLSQEDADGFRAAQADYVPLRTDMEDADRDAFNTSTSGWKKNEFHAAKGRDTLADSPLAWSIVQAERAIKASNANVTRQVAAALVRHAEKIGKPIGEIVPAHRFNKRWAFDIGDEVWTADALKDRPDIIFFKEDGRLKAIKVDGGKNALGITFAKAVTDKDVVRFNEKLNWINKIVGLLSAMRTQFVPTFILRNLKSDTMEVLPNMIGERGAKEAIKFMGRKLVNQFRDLKDVAAYFRTGEARGWMKEFVENGGLTGGGMAAEGFSEATRRIETMLKASRGGTGKKVVMSLAKVIPFLNELSEYSTRLGVYSTLRKEGVGVEDAISYARDITVNFNRKGEWTPITNASFMFSNARLQGQSRFLSSLRGEHGWQVAVYGLLVGVIGFYLKRLFGNDDDRERAGQSNARNISDHEKLNNIIIPLPGGTYFKWQNRSPINTLSFIAEKSLEALYGETTAEKAAVASIKALADESVAFFGGPGFDSAQTAIPTQIGRTYYQWKVGVDFKDDPRLRRKWNENLPDSWNGKANTPEPFKWFSKTLNWATGGSQYRKGWLDTSPENWQLLADYLLGGVGTDIGRVATTVQNIVLAAQGAKPDQVLRDVPFVRDTVTNMPDVSRRYYESFDEYDADRTEFRGVKGADGRLAFAARHPWVMDDRVKRLDKEIRELGKMEQGLEKKGGEWVAAERTPKERLEFRRQRLAKMAEFVGIMEEKPSGRLPPDAEYKILTQAFSDAKKEYETIQKDPLLETKHRKSILDEMRGSNPLLADKVRWAVDAHVKAVNKLESELKKMREYGTPEKYLKDAETNLQKLKDNVLKLIRENRRAE